MNHEEDVSTKQQAPEQETRLSCADAHPQRAEDPGRTAPQGASAPGRLSRRSFSGTARLRQSRDFQKVYRRGRRVHGRWMVVFACRREDESRENRFGITASRKVGGAVRRSRCKRRLRELQRLYGGVEGTGIDLVVNARKGLDRVPWAELVAEYLRCLRELELELGQPSGSSGSTSGGSRRRFRRRAGTSRPARSTLRRPLGSTGSSGAGGWVLSACYAATPSTPGATIPYRERK